MRERERVDERIFGKESVLGLRIEEGWAVCAFSFL